jgi:hypothetical protein
MPAENVMLSLKDVFQILEGWKSFLIIERRPDGQHSGRFLAKIIELSQDSGTLKFSGYQDERPTGEVVLALGSCRFFESSPSEGWITAYLPEETITFHKGT